MGNSGRASGRRFDREHGVTTQALFFLSQLGSVANEAYSHATHYEPVPVDAFRALISHLDEALVRRSTFVDVGSGMGRAALLACEFPFKQVLGIELSPALHAIASSNLEAARGLAPHCRDIRLRRGDARRYRYPKGNLVIFLFNPFDETVVRDVLERIVRSRGPSDTVHLLYHVPVHRNGVEEFADRVLADTADGIAVTLKRFPVLRDPSGNKC